MNRETRYRSHRGMIMLVSRSLANRSGSDREVVGTVPESVGISHVHDIVRSWLGCNQSEEKEDDDERKHEHGTETTLRHYSTRSEYCYHTFLLLIFLLLLFPPSHNQLLDSLSEFLQSPDPCFLPALPTFSKYVFRSVTRHRSLCRQCHPHFRLSA